MTNLLSTAELCDRCTARATCVMVLNLEDTSKPYLLSLCDHHGKKYAEAATKQGHDIRPIVPLPELETA
jgi:hypothetical protein